MYRQSPGRNHRSKGIKVKNVLQICLLLAVCFWLIYQVKHSHDKKKEFDESDAKASSSDELRRLGRKDIQTRVGGTLNKDEIHDDQSDEEEINGEEVDENKHEEDEVEDKKVDVKEDDETDEHEQEKSEAEADREDGDENETHDTDSEDGQIEKESSAEETDHDGDDSSTREEHYKADDASSAVTQNQHPENILEVENKESENQETYKSENSETKEDLLDNLANDSSPNNTVTQESNDHLMSNITIEDHGLSSENVMETNAQGNLTESVSAGGSDLKTIDSERANNSIPNVESTHLDSNSTVSDAKEFPNLSNNSPSENVLVEAGNNTETLLENNNEIEGEKSDTSDGTDENMETNENSEEVQQDAIDVSDSDTSISMDEKDVRTDLETLPEIQTEGANNEEDAAE